MSNTPTSEAVQMLRRELGDEPWSFQKIALAFAKVSGNMESVYEMEPDRKGSKHLSTENQLDRWLLIAHKSTRPADKDALEQINKIARKAAAEILNAEDTEIADPNQKSGDEAQTPANVSSEIAKTDTNAEMRQAFDDGHLGGLLMGHAEGFEQGYKDGIEAAAKIVDAAGTAWGDQARARKSKTFSAYTIAALDLQGQIRELAHASRPVTEPSEVGELTLRDQNQDQV